MHRARHFLVLAAIVAAASADSDFPAPFFRELAYESPPTSGNDVFLLQNLLKRSAAGSSFAVTGKYDTATASAVSSFNAANGIEGNTFVPATAAGVLDQFSEDGYHDDGRSARSQGFMYKVHVPLKQNRSVEVNATLFDADNNVLHVFRVRTHGANLDAPSTWPNFNNTDPGRNQFSSSGNTPTGLITFDLNSPEPNATLYGPYPINRAVSGLQGNAAFVLPHLRNGILLHTGQWPGWTPSMDMPNSEGCIHAHPEDIEFIWKTLTSMGVQVRKNPFGKLPYPFQPQGLLSVELVE